MNLWDTDQLGVRGTQRFDIATHGLGTSAAAGSMVGLVMAAS